MELSHANTPQVRRLQKAITWILEGFVVVKVGNQNTAASNVVVQPENDIQGKQSSSDRRYSTPRLEGGCTIAMTSSHALSSSLKTESTGDEVCLGKPLSERDIKLQSKSLKEVAADAIRYVNGQELKVGVDIIDPSGSSGKKSANKTVFLFPEDDTKRNLVLFAVQTAGSTIGRDKVALIKDEVRQLHELSGHGIQVPETFLGSNEDVLYFDVININGSKVSYAGFLEEKINLKEGVEINKSDMNAFINDVLEKLGAKYPTKDVSDEVRGMNKKLLAADLKKIRADVQKIADYFEIQRVDGKPVSKNDRAIPDFQTIYDFENNRICVFDPGNPDEADWNGNAYKGPVVRAVDSWLKAIDSKLHLITPKPMKLSLGPFV